MTWEVGETLAERIVRERSEELQRIIEDDIAAWEYEAFEVGLFDPMEEY